MAEIQQKDGKQQKGKQKKVHLRVDFTPMVDMNMLLITFFMLATTMIKPQTMEISMPAKDLPNDPKNQTEVKESKAVTILLGKDHKVYYFLGKPNLAQPILKTTDFSPKGLRAVLLDKNRDVVVQINELKQKKMNLQISKDDYDKKVSELKNGKETPQVVIRASDGATYSDLVNALDEMQICSIGKYMIDDFGKDDAKMFQNSNVPVK
mgnify:CR=1 FL=1